MRSRPVGAGVSSVSSERDRRRRVDPGVGGGRSVRPNSPNSSHSAQVDDMIAHLSPEVRDLTRPLPPNPGSHSVARPADGATAQGSPASAGPEGVTDRVRKRLERHQEASRPDAGVEGERIHVNLPDGFPQLTPRASRMLLDILVQLTTVEVFDPPAEGSLND
jgi:hypothetical protein